MLKKEKWYLCSLYKQPIVTHTEFKKFTDYIISSLGHDGCNFIITGDFNVNVLKSNCLKDIFEVNGVKNMVNVPTCYKSKIPTCLDLVVTNVHKRIQYVTCFDTGLSDFHHMVCFSTKFHIPPRKKQYITYRSYTKFDNNEYL